ncbi:MAG: hypothetical protein OEL83_07370 [Desulforhopalus sp.]|nr:hypothetical protein [Desulforhopalus sp.]
MKYFSPVHNWRGFCFLLLLAFFLKGIVYMAVLPPFEGWDEYQHLAYIVHLEKSHTRPVMHKDWVSRDLLRDIVTFPVSKYMAEQTAKTGALEYADSFRSGSQPPQYRADHPDITLYQAQHGSLYYWLMTPVVALVDGAAGAGIGDTLAALRAINCIFATLTLAALFWLIGRITPDKRAAALMALLLAAHPLFLLNSVRVANDALAILTGCLVVIIALLPGLRARLPFVACAGILIGLSCWAKSTSTALLPFWVCCLCLAYWKKEITFGRLLLFLTLSLLLAVAVLWEHLRFNLDHYGTLFFMQEAIINKEKNIGLAAILKLALTSNVFTDVYTLWLRDAIWTGGWSFLKVHNIKNISLALGSLAMLAWIYRLFVTRKKGFIATETSLLCLLFCLSISAAISWHYLQCLAAWGPGRATSNPWYLCGGMPFLLIFIFDSASRWSKAIGLFTAAALIATYLYADIRGLCTMITFYSGGDTSWSALAKIASIHPPWLSTPTLILASAVFLLITTTSMLLISRAAPQPSDNKESATA